MIFSIQQKASTHLFPSTAAWEKQQGNNRVVTNEQWGRGRDRERQSWEKAGGHQPAAGQSLLHWVGNGDQCSFKGHQRFPETLPCARQVLEPGGSREPGIHTDPSKKPTAYKKRKKKHTKTTMGAAKETLAMVCIRK